MILALDFDGVTHPEPCRDSDLFVRAPLIVGALADLPEIEIVISSSWRHDHTAEQIAGLLPRALSGRIVGHLPDYKKYLPPNTSAMPYPREFEMLLWLERTGRVGQEWVALDDWEEGFSPNCSRLILCDRTTGVTEEVAIRLRERLARSRRLSRFQI